MLLKESDDLILAVYDYWVDKRLRLKRPLAPKEPITYDVCIVNIFPFPANIMQPFLPSAEIG